MFNLNQTIAALASAPGSAAGGIVRISGGEIKTVLSDLFLFDDLEKWNRCKRASTHVATIQLEHFDIPLPATVYLWNNKRSYTGQPMAEIHTIGAPPILESLLAQLYQHKIQPARAGEFTLRAFLSGRIDLVQAEAVLGVIDAEDYVELNTALQQLAGGISTQLAVVQNDLIDLLSDLEAGLDFVDEEIEFVSREDLLHRLQSAHDQLQLLYQQTETRMRFTGQKKVVLVGLPNAGKSTLFNKLAGHDAALVSEISGTTRDYLSAEVYWQGIDIELIDTAGWDVEVSGIDKIAQTQRADQFDRADLLLWCRASDHDLLDQEDIDLFGAITQQTSCPFILITTKKELALKEMQLDDTPHRISLSSHTGEGIETLISEVVKQLGSANQGSKHFAGSTAARCRDSLSSAVTSLIQAHATATSEWGDEMVAIELRAVLEELGQILGTVYTDDILDRIFSKFCIGK